MKLWTDKKTHLCFLIQIEFMHFLLSPSEPTNGSVNPINVNSYGKMWQPRSKHLTLTPQFISLFKEKNRSIYAKFPP